jgi:formylglycine-generating enzyme required for sulfatase activity
VTQATAFAAGHGDAVPFLEPEMVAIPAGEFVMGSPSTEAGRHADEGPQRRVTIAPFAMGHHEVTFAEWDACAADGGCEHTPDENGWGRAHNPVINVSWNDVQQYLAWLNRRSKKSYRLPSEAEWEYAARAGTSTPFATGDCISSTEANFRGDLPYGECLPGEFRGRTAEAASLSPNPWGLHDMYGNVWEWTADCWTEDYHGAPAGGTPRDSGDCRLRVVRGGSWPYSAGVLRAAFRDKYLIDHRNDSLGFRLVR